MLDVRHQSLLVVPVTLLVVPVTLLVIPVTLLVVTFVVAIVVALPFGYQRVVSCISVER